MPLQRFHRAVDGLAMWVEDRVARAPEPFRPTEAGPLGCFGPLPLLPPAPDRPGLWQGPSPWPGGAPLEVHVTWPDAVARGVAILVPPWKIARPALVRGWVGLLRAAGYEVWLVVPPFHMGRAARGVRSGEGFVSADLGRLQRAVEQLVLELRALAALAAGRSGRTALVGLSLGALGAALCATCAETPCSVALIAPPLDLAAILERTRLGRRYRRLAEAAGAPLPEPPAVRAMVASLDPGARPLQAQRLFLAVGRQDAVATRRGHLPAVQGWGMVPRYYPRGHLTLLFACRQVRTDLAAFLEGG
jgi:hypothetical protein